MANKPARPRKPNPEHDRFEDLTRRLLRVPKREVDEAVERERQERAKRK